MKTVVLYPNYLLILKKFEQFAERIFLIRMTHPGEKKLLMIFVAFEINYFPMCARQSKFLNTVNVRLSCCCSAPCIKKIKLTCLILNKCGNDGSLSQTTKYFTLYTCFSHQTIFFRMKENKLILIQIYFFCANLFQCLPT